MLGLGTFPFVAFQELAQGSGALGAARVVQGSAHGAGLAILQCFPQVLDAFRHGDPQRVDHAPGLGGRVPGRIRLAVHPLQGPGKAAFALVQGGFVGVEPGQILRVGDVFQPRLELAAPGREGIGFDAFQRGPLLTDLV